MKCRSRIRGRSVSYARTCFHIDLRESKCSAIFALVSAKIITCILVNLSSATPLTFVVSPIILLISSDAMQNNGGFSKRE